MTNISSSNLIISFEGLDCCFKETNYNLFLDDIRNNNDFKDKKIFAESFPRYGKDLCKPIEKWLNGKLDRDVLNSLPLAKKSLYAIDRMDYWHSIHNENDSSDDTYYINDGIEYDFHYNGSLYDYKSNMNNLYFIFDRYTFSNTLYNPIGLYKSKITADEVLFEDNFFKVPKPDIVVWMRATNFEFIKDQLIAKKNKDKNELDLEYLESVWERSENMISNYDEFFWYYGINIIPIDINNIDLTPRSKESIAREVKNSIYELINKLSK